MKVGLALSGGNRRITPLSLSEPKKTIKGGLELRNYEDSDFSAAAWFPAPVPVDGSVLVDEGDSEIFGAFSAVSPPCGVASRFDWGPGVPSRSFRAESVLPFCALLSSSLSSSVSKRPSSF